MQIVQRRRARPDADVAQLLRHAEGVRPPEQAPITAGMCGSRAVRVRRSGVEGEPEVVADPRAGERSQAPELEQDVDGPAQGGGTGHERRRGVELVLRAGEDDEREGLGHREIHLAVLTAPADGLVPGSPETLAAAARSPSRLRRRTSTPRIREQAVRMSRSASRYWTVRPSRTDSTRPARRSAARCCDAAACGM